MHGASEGSSERAPASVFGRVRADASPSEADEDQAREE
jgi:hypothetical protein